MTDFVCLGYSRHPELVSGSMSPIARWSMVEEWTLKPVQGDGLSIVRQRRQLQSGREIVPIRVVALNQIDLPLAMPVLQLLLACDRLFHGAKQFVAHQAMHRVLFCKAVDFAVSMLPKTSDKIARDADVKRAAGRAGEDVDAGASLNRHKAERAEKWTLKQVQGDAIGRDRPHHSRHPELVSGSMPPIARWSMVAEVMLKAQWVSAHPVQGDGGL